MGLVDDAPSQSYQLVYSWPQNCDPSMKPRSLKDYLNSGLMPSLTDRMQLAPRPCHFDLSLSRPGLAAQELLQRQCAILLK